MSNVHSENRNRLMSILKGGLVVVTGFCEQQRINDCAHKFTQDANFLYLTGVADPEWMLIVDGMTGKEWLVRPKHDITYEVFNGNTDNSAVISRSGVANILDSSDVEKLLRDLSRKHPIVYTTDQPAWIDRLGFVANPALTRNRKTLERVFHKVAVCNSELEQLRAIKQPYEIAAIRSAVDVTVASFQRIKANLDTYRYEYQVEAEFTYDFVRRGTGGHAYDPIVAHGKNACTLHYIKNDKQLSRKQLLLLDIGAQVGGYASDISRTYAVGVPTKRQVKVHKAVEDAQKRIIELLTPGLSLEEYQRSVDAIMLEAIMTLGLVGSDKQKALHRYMPHAIGHGLGLDVHDSLGGAKTLQPNMILTVEPGIYIPEEGIGVRIEDDILITEKGHKNLSQKLSTSW